MLLQLGAARGNKTQGNGDRHDPADVPLRASVVQEKAREVSTRLYATTWSKTRACAGVAHLSCAAERRWLVVDGWLAGAVGGGRSPVASGIVFERIGDASDPQTAAKATAEGMSWSAGGDRQNQKRCCDGFHG